jgi:CRISPR system Cascade subunit CasD
MAEIIADANLLPDAAFTQTVKDRVESFDPQDRCFGFRLTAKERINLKNPCYEQKSQDIMDYL